MVTKSELLKFLPNAKASLVDAIVANWAEAEAAGITTPRRIRQFFSNIAVETGGLTAIVESLTYSSASRIRATWPTRFKTDAEAQPYVRQAKKLAVKVYGGRMGNAPYPSDDGWRFRGGGMMQTTGRAGYRSMGFENNPGILQSDPKAAFLVAVREWKNRRCNSYADADDTVGLRKVINGGTNGLAEVKRYLALAAKVWPDVKAIVDAHEVRLVQQRLKDLGYTEVGFVDGSVGPQTRTAILAFRDEHNLPLYPIIDTEFLQVLAFAEPRHLSRNDAGLDKVLKQVPEVKANWLSKILSAVTAFFTGIMALISGALDQLTVAKAYIDPLKETASGVPGWVWLILVALVATVIFLISRNGEKKGVAAFQSGERR